MWADGIRLATKLGFKFPNTAQLELYQVIPNASTAALELIADMLRFDPARRPTAAECLQHPFFADTWQTSPQGLKLNSAFADSPIGSKSPLSLPPLSPNRSKPKYDVDLDLDEAFRILNDDQPKYTTSVSHGILKREAPVQQHTDLFTKAKPPADIPTDPNKRRPSNLNPISTFFKHHNRDEEIDRLIDEINVDSGVADLEGPKKFFEKPVQQPIQQSIPVIEKRAVGGGFFGALKKSSARPHVQSPLQSGVTSLSSGMNSPANLSSMSSTEWKAYNLSVRGTGHLY